MSFTRVWRWLCNCCGAEVELHGYGLPRGWMIFADHRGETMHACSICEPQVPDAHPPAKYGGSYCRASEESAP
jgi:hypothetical protein